MGEGLLSETTKKRTSVRREVPGRVPLTGLDTEGLLASVGR